MGLLDGLFGGGNKSQTSTSSSAPWKPAQPLLKQGMGKASRLFSAGIGADYYKGSTVTPMDARTIEGNKALMGRARASMPGLNNAFSHMSSVAGGKFLNANPYLDEMIGQNTEDIMRAGKLASSAAGRYGSPEMQGVTQNQVGRMALQARGDNYARERSAQDAAANGLGQNYQNTLAPGTTMQDVGGQYEDLATRKMNDKLRIFDAKQNKPWENIGRLMGVAQGGGNAGTSSTVAQGPSRLGGTLGGALGGYQLTGGPGGALMGALAGYL